MLANKNLTLYLVAMPEIEIMTPSRLKLVVIDNVSCEIPGSI